MLIKSKKKRYIVNCDHIRSIIPQDNRIEATYSNGDKYFLCTKEDTENIETTFSWLMSEMEKPGVHAIDIDELFVKTNGGLPPVIL